jgi:hypothetical protein
MIGAAQRQISRTDRYVRKSRLRVGPSAPVHTLAFLMEESLRLCRLPGEEQGRVYCFRRLHVRGLTENSSRNAWLDAFQSELQVQARSAVHARQAAAAAADAVYFNNDLDIGELLLTAAATRARIGAWYWPQIAGTPPLPSPAQLAGTAIAWLLQSPASWVAVASAVFAVIAQTRSLGLLRSISREQIVSWLALWSRPATLRTSRTSPIPVRLNSASASVVAEAVRAFGIDSAEAHWLAALAVTLASPSTAENGDAISIGQASIRAMLGGFTTIDASAIANADSAPLEPGVSIQPNDELAPPATLPAEAGLAKPCDAWHAAEDRIQGPLPVDALLSPAPAFSFGEPTEGAGLYFLLNALSRLGIAEQRFDTWFIGHLILRFATFAELPPADSILLWAHAAIATSDIPEDEATNRLLRTWVIRVRRWCWHYGRLTLRDIIRRPGYVSLSRTDVDVTLALDGVDIRIRRIGLDLDPGWLPWFGRVVRFHYRYRGEVNG